MDKALQVPGIRRKKYYINLWEDKHSFTTTKLKRTVKFSVNI